MASQSIASPGCFNPHVTFADEQTRRSCAMTIWLLMDFIFLMYFLQAAMEAEEPSWVLEMVLLL